jgi:leucyl-tRNA synthetase
MDIDSVSLTKLNVEISFVNNDELNILEFKKWRDYYSNALFILEEGKYICGSEIEKMSKSKYNVVTPDDIVADYGADTLRLYEMFLGPLEQSKPWNTNGIEGVHRFLKKLWRLFYNSEGTFIVNQDEPIKAEFKALHKTIKKVADDIENFSFNTSVSNFMICVNELTDLKCNKQAILQDLLIVLSPYAPHIAEELWHQLGNTSSITKASFPAFNAEYLVEDEFSYPISINGKHRMNLTFSLQATAQEIEAAVLAHEAIQKWLEGKAPKKVIFVKGKIVNLVC